MSHPRVKWRDVDRYFTARGYQIRPSGGDKFIVAPKGAAGVKRRACCIGHKCCSNSGDEVWDCYLSQIRKFFGVTIEDLLNG